MVASEYTLIRAPFSWRDLLHGNTHATLPSSGGRGMGALPPRAGGPAPALHRLPTQRPTQYAVLSLNARLQSRLAWTGAVS